MPIDSGWTSGSTTTVLYAHTSGPGFKREGVLRDAVLTDGVYESLIVMSILKPERHARVAKP